MQEINDEVIFFRIPKEESMLFIGKGLECCGVKYLLGNVVENIHPDVSKEKVKRNGVDLIY